MIPAAGTDLPLRGPGAWRWIGMRAGSLTAEPITNSAERQAGFNSPPRRAGPSREIARQIAYAPAKFVAAIRKTTMPMTPTPTRMMASVACIFGCRIWASSGLAGL